MGDMLVSCGECQQVLDESPSIEAEARKPCPNCGSLTRLIRVQIHDTVSVHDDLAVKAKRIGQKKPFLEQKVGDDFHRATRTWRHRVMVVDRENDRYLKVVTNPATGEELHRTEEPLSEHQGHGSAKKQ